MINYRFTVAALQNKIVTYYFLVVLDVPFNYVQLTPFILTFHRAEIALFTILIKMELINSLVTPMTLNYLILAIL